MKILVSGRSRGRFNEEKWFRIMKRLFLMRLWNERVQRVRRADHQKIWFKISNSLSLPAGSCLPLERSDSLAHSVYGYYPLDSDLRVVSLLVLFV